MAFVATLLTSCVDPPPGSESDIWQRPPRYGHGGTESPKPSANDSRNSNSSRSNGNSSGNRNSSSRFGYSGGDSGDTAAETPPVITDEAPRDRDRDAVAEAKPEEKPAEKPKEEPKKSGPPSVAEMPFAKGVPGKPLSVTLPAPNAGLGEISIEQYEGGKATGKPLPPGTPVEIPDPGNPGKKIYFKVP